MTTSNRWQLLKATEGLDHKISPWEVWSSMTSQRLVWSRHVYNLFLFFLLLSCTLVALRARIARERLKRLVVEDHWRWRRPVLQTKFGPQTSWSTVRLVWGGTGTLSSSSVFDRQSSRAWNRRLVDWWPKNSSSWLRHNTNAREGVTEGYRN